MFMQIDNLYKQFQEAEIEFQIILCDKKQPGSSLRAACWFRLFRIAHESNLDGQNWIESVLGSLRFWETSEVMNRRIDLIGSKSLQNSLHASG